jgi:hypothetical protein
MQIGEKQLLTYSEVRNRQRTHPVRQSEVPVEHAVSLPVPSKRWLGPAYAFFAAPAARAPDRPQEQGPPDRWWVVDAHGGRLIVYALCAAVPFAPEAAFQAVTLPPVTRTLDELRAALKAIDALMDAAVPAFFAGQPGDPAARKALADALQAHLPQPLQPQYRALAPDFFAWLEA